MIFRKQPSDPYWKPTYHGPDKWPKYTYNCSVCGKFSMMEENFCPNCGAKMKKVRSDNPYQE